MKVKFFDWRIIALMLLLLNGCKKEDETPNPGNTVDQSLTGNSALNRFLLTSKDEEIIKVDANSGAHEKVFAFDNYVNVQSLDFANAIVYAGTEDNSMNAINLQSKSLLWDVPLLEYEESSLADPKVVVKDGVCYAAGIPGVLVAADAATGNVKWLYPLSPGGETDGYYSSHGRPTVLADKVIIGTSRSILVEGEFNYLHVLNKATGKRIWRKALPENTGISGTIKLAGNTLLVPSHDLLALDASTGNVLWTFKMEELSRGASSPSIVGDKVLVQGASGVADGRLYCLDLKTGKKLWEIEAGNDYAGVYSPLVIGNTVVGVHERGSSVSVAGNGQPFIADINTGKIIWENADLSVETSPVFANGRLFFHGQNLKGEGGIDNNVGLMCLDATTGKLLWLNNYFRYSSSVTPLVIADNGVFRSGSSPK